MANGMKKLPIGVENYEEMISERFYYIDKTGLLRELLQNWAKVNLFTRPRRFGKTLNMSMLKSFFEIGQDGRLFEGMEITQDTKLCDSYMGKFPVIFLTLKDVEADTYEVAYEMLCNVIAEEADRFAWLSESSALSQYDKEQYARIQRGDLGNPAELQRSLKTLSKMLYKHYGRQVIILIDEYDVPLEKAYQKRYYEKMISVLRSVLMMALKTNEYLYFAVLTGCLRISKESIFTGLNNLSVHTIQDAIYDEYFGFTDPEVRQLLEYYGISGKYEEVREWYDGYRFGKKEVYCPWDVLHYVKDHLFDPDAEPKLYWANSSSNSIVKSILEQSTGTVRNQIETLMAGQSIEKRLVSELTYQDLDKEDREERTDVLWSMLYATGYLTDAGKNRQGLYRLIIPNREILQIYEEQIQNWFFKTAKKDSGKLKALCTAVKEGDGKGLEEAFENFLQTSISIRDTYVKKAKKENFYQGILLGLLSSREEWIVRSNQESGEGYGDIFVEITSEKIGCILEVKYAENGALESKCGEALEQIIRKKYDQRLRMEGMQVIHAFGVACYKKSCKVAYQRLPESL